jgi:hypothetical protein
MSCGDIQQALRGTGWGAATLLSFLKRTYRYAQHRGKLGLRKSHFQAGFACSIQRNRGCAGRHSALHLLDGFQQFGTDVARFVALDEFLFCLRHDRCPLDCFKDVRRDIFLCALDVDSQQPYLAACLPVVIDDTNAIALAISLTFPSNFPATT